MKNIALFLTGLLSYSALIGAASTGKNIYHDANPPEIHNIGQTEVFTSKTPKLIITGCLHAEKSEFDYVSTIGPAYFESSKASSVRVTGSMETKDSQFSKIEVMGSFESDKTSAQNLYVTGSSKIKDSSFDTAIFTGRVKSKNSAFEKISANSDVQLENSKVKTLTITPNSNQQPQVVYLSGRTKIDNIRFEAGDGLVVIKGASAKVASVQGGNIERKA